MAFQRQSLFLLASFICCLHLCFAEDSVLTDLVSRVKALENEEKIRQTTPVAFQAVFKVGGLTHLRFNQTIVFPDVITNLGGGYSNLEGLFKAPRGGVYMFSTSIGSGSDRFIDVDIRVNGNMLASAMALGNTASHYGQGTVTVVSQLAANDEVCVSLRTPTGTSLQGNYFSSFMGCLVYPL